MVRDSEKAALIAMHYPQVEVVFGTLYDAKLLERESTTADVVLSTFVHLSCRGEFVGLSAVDFANCDHQSAAEAIVRGLATRNNIGTVIHTPGAKIIAWETESQPSKWGKDIPRRYNDWDGVEKLTAVASVGDPQASRS